MVKEDIEDFYEFHFSLLFHWSFLLFTWHLPVVVEKWTDKIVWNSLFLQEVTHFYNTLLGFSATKPICYKDVFFSNFCYPSSRLGNSLVVDVDFFFDLLSIWSLILELISSKGKMVIVMIMEMTKFIVQFSVNCGH